MTKIHKHEAFLKNTSFRSVLISLSLFALLVAACQSATMEEPQPAVVVVDPIPTQTAVPTATLTPTEEPNVIPTNPAPGEVEEFPSPDQVWLEEGLFAFARAFHFKPVFDVAYYPETVTIPWTVDAQGNTVQGITSLDICGTGIDGDVDAPYIGWFRVGNGYPQDYVDSELTNRGMTSWIGPNFKLVQIQMGLSPDAVGFVLVEELPRVKSLWLEAREEAGHDYYPELYPELVIPVCESLANKLLLFPQSGDPSDSTSPVMSVLLP